MPKIYKPPFAQVPKTQAGLITAALSGIGTDTVTNAVLIATAGADGAVVTSVSVIPRATATASSIALFLSKDGITFRLIDSELMSAYTLSVTTAIPETRFGNISAEVPLRLEAGDKLYIGSQVALAAGIVALATWMDY